MNAQGSPLPAQSAEGTHTSACSWNPEGGYRACTPYGEIRMFDEGGHRAVELMLLSAAACLNFFLVEYAASRGLPVRGIRVACDGELVARPNRVGRIHTRVEVDGDLSEAERRRMLSACERACKVMNTLKHLPECHTSLVAGTAA